MYPYLLNFGAFKLHSYGLMLGLSFIAGIFIGFHYVKKADYPKEIAANVFFAAILGSIIGARLLFVLTNLDRFNSIGDWFSIWKGGMVAYGGFIGAILSGFIYLRFAKKPFWELLDYCTPSIALGVCLTRIGCLLNGCCYGAPTTSFFGISYPPTAKLYTAHLDLTPQTLFHPTPLYESAMGLLIFLTLIAAFRSKKFHGFIFLIFVFMYSVGRFIIEFFRYDTLRGGIGFLSTSQIISILGFIFGIIAYFYLKKIPIKPRKKP